MNTERTRVLEKRYFTDHTNHDDLQTRIQTLKAKLCDLDALGFTWVHDCDEDGGYDIYPALIDPKNTSETLLFEDDDHANGGWLEALERLHASYAWRVTTCASNRSENWKERVYTARIEFVPAPPERLSNGLLLGEARAAHPLEALMLASITALEHYQQAGTPLKRPGA